MKLFLLTAAFAALFALLNCTSQVAGGGTETTNGISGTVAVVNASRPDGGTVIAAVYSVNYRPDSGLGIAETTIVDYNGAFRFDSLPDSSYNLFIWDTTRHNGAYVPALPADTTLGTIALTGMATLAPHAASAAIEIRFELMIRGSPFYYRSDAGSTTMIPNVPGGTYQINLRRVWETSVDTSPVYDKKYLTIDPNTPDTVHVSFP